MSDAAIYVEASRLMAIPKITFRVEQLRATELPGKSIGLFKEVQVEDKPARTIEEIDAEI